MKKVILTILTVVMLGSLAFGQWQNDSLTMGPGSGNDVFYSLKNGIVKVENNKNWHLAFSPTGGADSASVWANHNAQNAFVKVYNIHKEFSQWSTVTLADTATATLGFNNDQGWDQGALNMNGSSAIQYGWGHYAGGPSHDVVGDSIYIIKANGVFYKFFINSLVGIGPNAGNWNFQIDTFSGATIYDTIKAANYTNSHFAYYDLATLADTNREPAKATWDLVFNRYSTNDPTSGPNPFNSVIGALRNIGVKISKANLIHVDTAYANYKNYVSPWLSDSSVISAVGFNWKTFTPPTTWTVPDSISYFVKDVPGNIYQLQFLEYSGSGTGNIKLRKRLVEPVGVKDFNSLISSYEFYPNPAQNELFITLDVKQAAQASLFISSLTGEVIYNSLIKINAGLNAFNLSTANLPNGNYVVSIKGKDINLNHKVTISK